MRLRYKLTSPLSHIGESASTDMFFQSILTCNGAIPVITGNSVRGTVRDFGSIHLLDAIGTQVEKEVFHVLFSGGNLNTTTKNDLAKASSIREFFPLLSVLGAAVGDMILSGKSMFQFAYPICKEAEFITGIPSDLSWRKMIEEINHTRVDDGKKDQLKSYLLDPDAEKTGTASTQMLYTVQYMAPGTEFSQEIKLVNCTDLELGALCAAIKTWLLKKPVLGGMSSKGFGFFDLKIEGDLSFVGGILNLSEKWERLIQDYETFLQSTPIAEQFHFLKGGAKIGKETGKTTKSKSKTTGREV